MNLNQNFDELIREKLQSSNLEFTESKWENARALIEKEERLLFRKKLLYFSASVLLVLVGLGLFLVNSTPSKNNEKVQNIPVKIISPKKPETSPSANPVNNSIPNTAETALSKNIVNSDRKPDEEKQNKTNNQLQNSEKNKTFVSAPVSSQLKTIPSSVEVKNKIESPADENKNGDEIPKTAVAKIENQKKEIESTPNSSSTNILKSASFAGSTIKISATQIEDKPEFIKPLEINLAFETSAHSNDSLDLPLVSPKCITLNNENFYSGKYKRTSKIYLIAGENYVFSSSGTALNPVGGIAASREINLGWEIGTGLYYTYIPTPTNPTKTFIGNTYGFGIESNKTEVKTDNLHYLVVPIYLQFNLGMNNRFQLGVNGFYLLTTSNRVSTYREVDGVKQNVATKNDYGYSNGYSTVDIGIMAGYERNLLRNLSAGIYLNYGLMDMTSKVYFGNNTFDRNISGQFCFKYKLYNH